MQQRKQYTETESVIKPCLKIVANLLLGGKNALEKVQQIPMSNDTMTVRSAMTAQDLKQQLIAKFIEAPCFALLCNLTKPQPLLTVLNLMSIMDFQIKVLGKLLNIFYFAIL